MRKKRTFLIILQIIRANLNCNGNYGCEGNMTQEYRSKDVDELVAEIKENLRLRSRPGHVVNKQRASPYSVPGKFCPGSRCHSCGSPKCMRTCLKKPESDDPYELLQMLLHEGSLIKEAVKRLQTEPDEKQPKQDKDFYGDCDSHTPVVCLDLS